MRVHAFYITLLIIACVVIFYLFHKLDHAEQTIIAKESIITEKQSILSKRVNSAGETVITKPVAIADVKSLKAAYPQLVAEIEAKAGIKSKNLAGALQAQLQALGKGRVEIYHDTVKVSSGGKETALAHVEIDDGYLRLKGDIHSDIIDYVDYNYLYNDTLLIAVSKKKHLLRGGETLEISGLLQNPNAQIVRTTGIAVHEIRPKRFNISVGVYYDPLKGQFGPAVTAGWSLIRF